MRRPLPILAAFLVQAQRQRSMPLRLQMGMRPRQRLPGQHQRRKLQQPTALGLAKKPVLRPRGRRGAVEANKGRVVPARSLLADQPHRQQRRCPLV